MGAVLMELNEKYESQVNPLFYHPVLRELESRHDKLAKIALEQQQALAA